MTEVWFLKIVEQGENFRVVMACMDGIGSHVLTPPTTFDNCINFISVSKSMCLPKGN